MQQSKHNIYANKRLENLRLKLLALDVLMHANATSGNIEELAPFKFKNDSRSNPFTKNNNTFSN
ncbi:hypothetical protein [Ancylomarina longa]|uniref:Uncharacterized protein n=1 Tax=Ancylomarina longa TaxID=2487017 RepID=A0A434AY98_9BACT|nr:hypothetical protein [Ancylomarina longa]RUT79541.1 hypothetical protein DLK05_02295 [Ancylomarina longa]